MGKFNRGSKMPEVMIKRSRVLQTPPTSIERERVFGFLDFLEYYKEFEKGPGRRESVSEQERGYLGEIDINHPDCIKAVEKVKKPPFPGSELPFRVELEDAFDITKRFQPRSKKNPDERVALDNPEKPFLSEIYRQVSKKLELFGESKDALKKDLKVFTSARGPMDVFAGSDFVVEYGEKIIRVDIKRRDKKEMTDKELEKLKAEIILFYKDLPDPDDEKEREDMNDLAKQLSNKIIAVYIKSKEELKAA